MASSTHHSSTKHIAQLSQIIAKAVSDIQVVCEKNAFTFPSLDDPFDPASEDFRSSPEGAEAASLIAAAAFQLAAAVLPPPIAVYGMVVSGVYKSACLRVCIEANVVEILREAGPEGLHADEIGAKCNIQGQKLARILRFLASHHVFRELSPDIFTNTRLSSVLDTKKSVAQLFSNPLSKHDNTSGFPAYVCHHLDESAKSSTFLWETLSEPRPRSAPQTPDTAFSRAFNTDASPWEFRAQEGQTYRHKRFEYAMLGVDALQPADAILKAYDWNSLPGNAIVVDVGSGVGTASLRLAQAFPHLRLVNQDLPPTIEAAQKVWRSKLPRALESGQVTLQAHDFFAEQPIKTASIFLIKQILHDWPDAQACLILTQLRKAAQPDKTKLVIIDTIIPFACPFSDADDESLKDIPGAVPREAPAPLLANYGVNSVMGYVNDITMMMAFDAQERTVRHLAELLKRTGWRLEKVGEGASFLKPVVAVPA